MNHYWYRPDRSISFGSAQNHAQQAVYRISDSNLKTHLRATSILAKGLKAKFDAIKSAQPTQTSASTPSVPSDLLATAKQVRLLSTDLQAAKTFINTRLDTLETKVTGIESSLELLISLLIDHDVKKGEKVEKTKCTPDLVFRKDDDNSGNDGDARDRETSDAARISSSRMQSKYQTRSMQSTHVSDYGVKTVKTVTMTEEQTTFDRKQTLPTISEGDEDLFIANEEDALHLFKKVKTVSGEIISMYHNDILMQQYNARHALALSIEETPDVTTEEFLKEHKKIMESFSKKSKTPTAGRGRGSKSVQTIPRQTRSSGTRIDEVDGGNTKILSTTTHEDPVEEEDIETGSQLITRRKKVCISDTETVQDVVLDNEEVDLLIDIRIIVYTAFIDSHNSEVDEEIFSKLEAERRMWAKAKDGEGRDTRRYVNNLMSSDPILWKDSRRKVFKLEKSYSSVKESEKKWKHVNNLKCNRSVNFHSLRSVPSATEEVSDIEKSKNLWSNMHSFLKGMASYTRGGIGSKEAELLEVAHVDHYSLVDSTGEKLTTDHLWKLEAVDIVADSHDSAKKVEKILYFMNDGSVKKMSLQQLLIKSTKELKYVHYLLNEKK